MVTVRPDLTATPDSWCGTFQFSTETYSVWIELLTEHSAMQTLVFYTLFLQLRNDWDRDVVIIFVIVILSIFRSLARYTLYHHHHHPTLSRSFVKHRTNPTDSSWSFKLLDTRYCSFFSSVYFYIFNQKAISLFILFE